MVAVAGLDELATANRRRSDEMIDDLAVDKDGSRCTGDQRIDRQHFFGHLKNYWRDGSGAVAVFQLETGCKTVRSETEGKIRLAN